MRFSKFIGAISVSLLVLITVPTSALSADDTPALLKFSVDDLARQNAESEVPYLEFMRVESMSTYLYELPAGATDEQTPHNQDEIYYVVSGRAKITVDAETTTVEPGDIIFVKKFADHKFIDITEDLQLVVVFAPPDTE